MIIHPLPFSPSMRHRLQVSPSPSLSLPLSQTTSVRHRSASGRGSFSNVHPNPPTTTPIRIRQYFFDPNTHAPVNSRTAASASKLDELLGLVEEPNGDLIYKNSCLEMDVLPRTASGSCSPANWKLQVLQAQMLEGYAGDASRLSHEVSRSCRSRSSAHLKEDTSDPTRLKGELVGMSPWGWLLLQRALWSCLLTPAVSLHMESK